MASKLQVRNCQKLAAKVTRVSLDARPSIFHVIQIAETESLFYRESGLYEVIMDLWSQKASHRAKVRIKNAKSDYYSDQNSPRVDIQR